MRAEEPCYIVADAVARNAQVEVGYSCWKSRIQRRSEREDGRAVTCSQAERSGGDRPEGMVSFFFQVAREMGPQYANGSASYYASIAVDTIPKVLGEV